MLLLRARYFFRAVSKLLCFCHCVFEYVFCAGSKAVAFVSCVFVVFIRFLRLLSILCLFSRCFVCARSTAFEFVVLLFVERAASGAFCKP